MCPSTWPVEIECLCLSCFACCLFDIADSVEIWGTCNVFAIADSVEVWGTCNVFASVTKNLECFLKTFSASF